MMIKFGLNVFARQPSLSSQVVSASPPVIFPVNEFISLYVRIRHKLDSLAFIIAFSLDSLALWFWVLDLRQ